MNTEYNSIEVAWDQYENLDDSEIKHYLIKAKKHFNNTEETLEHQAGIF